MGMTIRTALLAACVATSVQLAQAQDQEQGPVELAPTSAEVSPRPVRARAGGTLDPSTSSAPRAPREAVGALRVYGGFRLGVGGGFKPTDPDADFLALAKATPGLQLGVDYVVMEYFAIGAETRLSWPGQKEGDSDRIMLWDLVLKPRARKLLDSYPLEIYAAMPIGVTVANMDNDARPEQTGKAHATLGLSGGGYYFFHQHMGVNAELGWLWNWVHYNDELAGDFKTRLGQLTLINVNFVYAF